MSTPGTRENCKFGSVLLHAKFQLEVPELFSGIRAAPGGGGGVGLCPHS